MNYARDSATRTRAHDSVLAFRDAIQPRLDRPGVHERALLDILARANPRLLDDGEIGSNALIILFGGIETTEALIANALWSWLFFAWHLGGLAFAEVLLLWLLIASTLVAFWRIKPAAGLLLVPYLAWVTFASALNYALWQLNPAILG